jgi:DnaB-like helicase N terminal domain
MTELKHRAERAVLGALITDPRSTGYTGLTTEDFDDQRHRVIFTALAGPGQRTGGLFRRLRDWLADFRQRGDLRELESYLDTLPDACPDPGHLRSYVEMLTASRPQPEPAASGSSPDASATLAQAASALTGQHDARPAVPEDEVERLARALRGRTPSLNPRRDPEPVPARVAPTPAGTAISGQVTPAPPARGEPTVQPATPADAASSSTARTEMSNAPAARPRHSRQMTTEDLQDLVLADLLNHPGGARDVVSWLPVTAFTPGARQQLYELAASMIAENYPVDPLIVAWEADQLRAAAGGRSLDGAFVLRTGALDTPPGTAAELGRWLLADWWCGTTLGDDWHTRPLPARSPAGPDASPAEPDPAAPQPALDTQQQQQPVPAATQAPSSQPPRPAPAATIVPQRPATVPPPAPVPRP